MLWERIRLTRGRQCRWLGLVTAIFCSFAAVGRSLGQEAIATPALGYFGTISSPSVSGTSQLGSFAPPFPSDFANYQALFRWGPVRLRPSLNYNISSSEGLQAQAGQPQNTIVQVITPTFLFELGDHWTLNYSPSFRSYSSSAFKSSTDQIIGLNGATTYERWSLGLSQSYGLSTTPLVETGGQTEQETYSTDLSATYQLNSKLSLGLGVRQNLRFVGRGLQPTSRLSDSKEWSTTASLNYQILPKVSAGVTVGFGYAIVGLKMTYEQLQAHVAWIIVEKLTLSANGGFETRQFLNSEVPAVINPISTVSIQYQLFKVTSLSLSSSRTVSQSYFENQIIESFNFDLGLRQRLFGKLSLDVSGGFGTSTYKSVGTSLITDRQDDSTHYRVALSMPFLKRGRASVFYSVSDNSSDQAGFSPSVTSIGLSLNYQF